MTEALAGGGIGVDLRSACHERRGGGTRCRWQHRRSSSGHLSEREGLGLPSTRFRGGTRKLGASVPGRRGRVEADSTAFPKSVSYPRGGSEGGNTRGSVRGTKGGRSCPPGDAGYGREWNRRLVVAPPEASDFGRSSRVSRRTWSTSGGRHGGGNITEALVVRKAVVLPRHAPRGGPRSPKGPQGSGGIAVTKGHMGPRSSRHLGVIRFDACHPFL